MSEEEKAEFLGNIWYFWHEKGDIERYCDFSIDKLEEAKPALAMAYKNYLSAKEIFQSMMGDYDYDKE